MLASQIPTKFQIPFGKSAAAGTIRPIPVADQTATSPGAASLTTGFPVATGQPLASGGVPPAMQDFNGLFNQITAWSQWQNAGGTVTFDQTFCTAVGGYPQGAVLASSATPGLLWLSLADNNTTNPDGGSASGWVGLITTATLGTRQIVGSGAKTYATPGTSSWTVPAGVTVIETEIWGGGGSGSGGLQGFGGGPGGYSKGAFAVQPGQTITVVVGAGGAGSASANGNTGGTTSVSGPSGTFNSANGGTGGVSLAGGVPGAGGNPGSSSGGSVNVTASRGGGAAYTLGSNYGGGAGGAAPFGGAAGQVGFNSPGTAGVFPGGGGNGASVDQQPGGAGATGFAIIRY